MKCFWFCEVYEDPSKKKAFSGGGPDLTSGVDLGSVRYEYSYPDSNSNHSKVENKYFNEIIQ